MVPFIGVAHSFFKALNPWSSCFTCSDFEDALTEIKMILKQLDFASHHDLSFKEKQHQLEKAFQLALLCLNAANKPNPDKDLSFLFADILLKYATLSHTENYFVSKQLYLFALQLHLYTIGVIQECLDLRDYVSLNDLKTHLANHPNVFAAFEQLIVSTSYERCAELARKESFIHFSSEHKLYSLAETARQLGYCYQQLDETKWNTENNNRRFSMLFGLSEALYLLLDNKKSHHGLADLYLNASPFMERRSHPDHILEVFQYYDKALAYDNSNEVQAKVALGRFWLLFSQGQKREAFSYLQLALSFVSVFEKNNQNLLLLSLYDGLVSYFMDPETIDLDQAENTYRKLSNLMAKSRAQGIDMLEFAIYSMKLAEFKLVKNEISSAQEEVTHALTTLQKHPFSQQSYIFDAEALNSFIAKSLHQ
jgi:hypothetical protein